MDTNNDDDTLRRLAYLVDRLEEVEKRRMLMAETAPASQKQAVLVIALVLFVTGCIMVFVFTQRASLVFLVALICAVGAGIAQIGTIPSKPFSRDY